MKLGLAVALVVLTLATLACTTPSDPVGVGSLCTPPGPECPEAVVLQRGSVGRNALDFQLTNRAHSSEVTFRITSPGDETDAPLAVDDETRPELYSRAYALEADDDVFGQLSSRTLGTVNTLQLSLVCTQPPCDAVLDYVFISEPLECIDDGECSRPWRCEQSTGRCVECLVHSDCLSATQSCDLEAGRCVPPQDSVCTIARMPAPGSPLPALTLALLAGGLLLLRRHGRRGSLLGAVLLAAAAASMPLEAAAGPPRAGFALGGGPRMITGELGEFVAIGYGYVLTQELRRTHYGMAIGLTTASFETSQQPPPHTYVLQSYGVSLGPRGYWSLGAFEFTGGVDYLRWGLASNSLVRYTGLGVSFNAVGATGGVRYRWSSLEARFEAGLYPIFELPGSIVSLNFMVGIAGR
ncbi:MAG: hypothetical protein H0U74_07675 [Bradymonadaceae bacterium]|nr:hypothetical protein [Lujinxingiaceae bacterium]